MLHKEPNSSVKLHKRYEKNHCNFNYCYWSDFVEQTNSQVSYSRTDSGLFCKLQNIIIYFHLSERLQAYQDATGLTDEEIDLISQESNLRYMENVRLAQYAYNNGDVNGLVSPLIWNDEIINLGIGNSFYNFCEFRYQ